eukprot:CAMPEP_0194357064 /NCGR_PEP_ID=MMETSP0174-20130528/4603_1 /TAXON_ID=216777 /ORGANISM="Proboscia alata, Strain PI-D3" /LENGTH=227 /DNA_ID=CAMNT_0039126933 /DNA_START=544 /DNA_END=1227 /DNA_ORIENTATION=+
MANANIHTDGKQVDDMVDQSKSIRICVVGARAEATLPSIYWNELLLAIPEEVINLISIDFVGPDVPRGLKPRQFTIGGNKKKKTIKFTFYSKHLQKHTSMNGTEKLWDAFVLFNPGLGHPNLEAGWIDTLQFILNYKRGVPVLFTAYNSIDAERDHNIIREAVSNIDNLSKPRHNLLDKFSLNPFASRLGTVDDVPSEGSPATNHSDDESYVKKTKNSLCKSIHTAL